MINVLIYGYSGALGQVVEKLVMQDENFNICAKINSKSNIFDCDTTLDVIIDCSTAKAMPNLLDYAKKNNVPVVLCTTGLDLDTENMIAESSKSIAIFKSANMSLGINLISGILKQISPTLKNAGFDIEILEKHHNKKIDAPSGTAMMLADTINESLDNTLEYTYDRSEQRNKRKESEIGFSSIRGGTIVGEHTVIFAGNGEVIEIKHSALSKELFAVGAINAAKFIVGKNAGIYGFSHLMQ